MKSSLKERGKKPTYFKLFLFVLYFSTTVIYIYFSYRGLNYYLTPLLERPHHGQFITLKPGGTWGHGFGVVGSFMMIFMLLYSVRKRTTIFSRMGSLPNWLNIHIFLGIFGPLFIILHSTFKVYGLVAISFWSMILVALSGVLGRYIYLLIPRNIQGEELNIQQIKKINLDLEQKLKEEFNLTNDQINQLEQHFTVANIEDKNVFYILFKQLLTDLTLNSKIKKYQKSLTQELAIDKAHIKKVIRLSKEKVKLQQKIQSLRKVQNLFHYWHVLHKPFAIIMLLIMTVHVIVAILFGYRWIF